MENRNLAHFAELEQKLKSLFLSSFEGDDNAYYEFLLTLSGYLRGFFRKRMQANLDQVEDLVQEVLLAIHVKRHTYNKELPISAWIHAISKYKYIDFLRRRRSFVEFDLFDDSSELFGQSDNTAFESKRDINKLLLSLPDALRIPIQLTKLDGYSVKEASKIASISESAIKIGVHRGLKKLSSALGVKYEN
jgi:RNA polymerase sigma-70 factor (ECF subfamily)